MASVKDFGAKGDGQADDTAAILHAARRGDGLLVFPRGDYRITRPIVVPLDATGRITIDGSGGTARLWMHGPGPALQVVGTHRKSALPAHFEEKVWERERMPTIRDLEIVGQHADADGIQLDGAMQPTLTGLLIRRCRYGVHLHHRDRNVILNGCHIYHCSGIGVFLDRVNLHQINITGCHISYCKRGGIVLAGSEIRNIQIVGNDIEYNFDAEADTSADVLFDCRDGTVREGTIVGNTIQAVPSPNGATVRLLGAGATNAAVGLLAITGNLIGSQQTLLHLQRCRGVVVSGNSLYNGESHAILAEDSEHLVIGANSVDHNPEYRGQSTDRLVFHRCANVSLTGLVSQHTREAKVDDPASLDLVDCTQVNVVGCQFLGARQRGIRVRDSRVIRIADNTIRANPESADFQAAIEVDDKSRSLLLINNFLAVGKAGPLKLLETAGIATGNVSL